MVLLYNGDAKFAFDGAHHKTQTDCKLYSSVQFKLYQSLCTKSAKDFSLTPNELTYILILASAALIQTASLIERGFRKLTDFNPIFIYNAYPSLMHILTILSVLVVFSLVIDAYRGFYTRRDSTSRSSSM
ncbi:hypothetical protein [Pseudoalteromonas sp. OANN1]|uniref:hypothetical protein n=1 Tax=Pseudoalteromonas sp. OANN1 TaxID=2954497 RepID=UPI002097B2FA|nr:hypothetical protein [Pseudoalteromonas sp. OANN1]MCO7201182.1 hypothetical protein [Pseudoalteromonas sp. OANN1]